MQILTIDQVAESLQMSGEQVRRDSQNGSTNRGRVPLWHLIIEERRANRAAPGFRGNLPPGCFLSP